IECPGRARCIAVPTKNYSSGMQLRLGFAIAVHLHAEVFLIDEVLAVGDERFSQKCRRRFDEERAAGCTFLVATHDLAFVEERCDRAALLIEGRVAAVGTAKETVQAYRDQLVRADA